MFVNKSINTFLCCDALRCVRNIAAQKTKNMSAIRLARLSRLDTLSETALSFALQSPNREATATGQRRWEVWDAFRAVRPEIRTASWREEHNAPRQLQFLSLCLILSESQRQKRIHFRPREPQRFSTRSGNFVSLSHCTQPAA